MEFRILGPLEVQAGSRRLDVGGIRQQTVLAMLLLSAGHVVTTDRLLQAIYGEDLPPTSRSQAQIRISALRRLFATHGSAGIISSRGQGYALQAGDGQLEQVHQRLFSATGEGARLAVPVVVIVGQGGVGKTCLAVRSAHGLAGRFSDGQLFADLHGGSGRPVSPVQVLERFLRALGVPGGQLPEGLDERAEEYRNLLADRNVLVVLDDAADESQVSPLLPGAGPAAVLVTSRGRLAGLAGAEHVKLDVFDERTSLELLGRIAGLDRVVAQPGPAAAVAGQCGHLPLALRIAGARLATRPHRSIKQLADRLADETA